MSQYFSDTKISAKSPNSVPANTLGRPRVFLLSSLFTLRKILSFSVNWAWGKQVQKAEKNRQLTRDWEEKIKLVKTRHKCLIWICEVQSTLWLLFHLQIRKRPITPDRKKLDTTHSYPTTNSDFFSWCQSLNVHHHDANQCGFDLARITFSAVVIFFPPIVVVHADDKPLELGTIHAFLEGITKNDSSPCLVKVAQNNSGVLLLENF